MTEQRLLDLIARARDEEWKELNLDRLGLSILPPEIGDLVKLKRLILGSPGRWDRDCLNQITDLPEEFGRLKSLEMLVISCNQLSSIPKPIEHLSNLRILDLSRNGIAAIPDFIGQLANLKVLNLSRNYIEVIPASIGRLAKLQNLNLIQNMIT